MKYTLDSFITLKEQIILTNIMPKGLENSDIKTV